MKAFESIGAKWILLAIACCLLLLDVYFHLDYSTLKFVQTWKNISRMYVPEQDFFNHHFIQYQKTIESARIEVLSNIQQKHLNRTLFNNRNITKVLQVNTDRLRKYFPKFYNSLLKLENVKTVSFNCTMDKNASNKDVPFCGTFTTHTYYKWGSSKELCSVINDLTPENCRKYTNITVDKETNFPHLLRQNNFLPLFYMSVIPFGTVDTRGNVITGGTAIFPFQCTPYMAKKPKYYQYQEEVFVLSQDRSEGFHHFNDENFPRIAAYVNFLRKYDQIKIHVHHSYSYVSQVLIPLGISPARIVNGSIDAKVIYLPQGGGCQMRMEQPSGQLLSLFYREYIRKHLPRKNEKYIVVQKRQLKRWVERQQHNAIIEYLRSLAPKYNLVVKIWDDKDSFTYNETMLTYSNAVLVFGPHGAGFAHMLHLKPGSFVIEVVCDPSFRLIAQSLGLRYYGILDLNRRCKVMKVDLKFLFSIFDLFLHTYDLEKK